MPLLLQCTMKSWMRTVITSIHLASCSLLVIAASLISIMLRSLSCQSRRALPGKSFPGVPRAIQHKPRWDRLQQSAPCSTRTDGRCDPICHNTTRQPPSRILPQLPSSHRACSGLGTGSSSPFAVAFDKRRSVFQLRSISSPPLFDSSSRSPSVGFSSTSSTSSSSAAGDEVQDSRLELYMWGTDTKGSLLKPKDRADEKVLDVPQRIDGASHGSFYTGSSSSAPSEDEATSPTLSTTLQDAALSRIICGATDTAYLLSDGSCFVTGENKQGQLGVGHKNPVSTPSRLVLPPPSIADDDNSSINNAASSESSAAAAEVVDLALGPSFAAAVDSRGNLYTCGLGGSVIAGFGMLGHGSADSLAEFRHVESLVEDGCRVRQVQVGESHMAVLTTDGEVSTNECGESFANSKPWRADPDALSYLLLSRSSRAAPGATGASATSTRPTNCTWSRSKC
jgi:Regulator of chromosome condensation (RCC1) repeat